MGQIGTNREDMQIYVLRLLLKYARVIDNGRNAGVCEWNMDW
jgi:hypothetical protein